MYEAIRHETQIIQSLAAGEVIRVMDLDGLYSNYQIKDSIRADGKDAQITLKLVRVS